MLVLGRIERRYRLPKGYFKDLLPHQGRAVAAGAPGSLSSAERRRLAWHLPDDFGTLCEEDRAEILQWIRTTIIGGATEYRRFQSSALRHPYALKFGGTKNSRAAPRQLDEELAALVKFKTASLTPPDLRRSGLWSDETAAQRIEHFGLMFGALSAPAEGPNAGAGVPTAKLTFAMLVFPRVWDWYLRWRERRRGFFTSWEVDMLRLGLAMAHKETGWLKQSPELVHHLGACSPLVDSDDVVAARQDWPAACHRFCSYAANRAKEITRLARVHRDPFEPILPILEAQSPVSEYRKITEEILRRKPDGKLYPRAAAEAVRSFLLIRLGLHLGIRQRNLRQLLMCPMGKVPRSEVELRRVRQGELRWLEDQNKWEVFIPCEAFKNANSTFFGSRPFRLFLPDLGGLYRQLADYAQVHRAVLLAGAPDPGTFFVKTVKRTSRSAAYDKNTFYEAWRLVIQRYGVWNPFTGRGAIPGLLPHGPHCVRDVLATHILKQTGSFEQASYAIQDTPAVVAKHYGRFLPQDKSALAAAVLNRAWE